MKKKNQLSATHRSEYIKLMSSTEFDLLIIGGGITGAGIALDAVTRGLKVALVEKQDFAAGTSSRSTKLIHGGLRYLEQFELALVKEVGRERDIVYKNAAHIVIPEKLLLPIIKNGSLSKFTTSVALTVYDFLAGVKKNERYRMLNKYEVIAKEPTLNNQALIGGAIYYEYKTDDSRLTIEILKKAVELGATVANYADTSSFLYKNDKIIGAEIIDLFSGNCINIHSKYVVNATGAWVDQMRMKDGSKSGKTLHLSKGIHIVVPKSKFNLNHAIYFDVGDNRMIFAIPKMDVVYIGTTDTTYHGNIENPCITKQDVKYLINAVNKIWPALQLSLNDVDSAWAGIRPLIHKNGKKPSELSRKDEIFFSHTGLLSIAGGKLTGYRIMAKKVVDYIRKKMKLLEKREIGKCITKNIKLAGGEFLFEVSQSRLVEFADKKFDEAKQTGISVEHFKQLFYRYGTNIDLITNKAFDFYNLKKNTELAWLKAEVWYSVNYEMATSLVDFFIRRTGTIHFNINKIQFQLKTVADEMEKIFNWSIKEKNEKINEMNNAIDHAKTFN